eukprot:CAMPEP_0175007072 /NCGR_PEP_ID=MMETSP0005-20121125/6201_1 /TAXON_ID=420556 /ORGANISM="Ochromonas sp., Strain CCMP1393" /LENGTH=368 /DNA_ID=CAMNT_0016262459 /DNA_START=248 /DNA_END=1351 /DNA_ORIENTATION=-
MNSDDGNSSDKQQDGNSEGDLSGIEAALSNDGTSLGDKVVAVGYDMNQNEPDPNQLAGRILSDNMSYTATAHSGIGDIQNKFQQQQMVIAEQQQQQQQQQAYINMPGAQSQQVPTSMPPYSSGGNGGNFQQISQSNNMHRGSYDGSNRLSGKYGGSNRTGGANSNNRYQQQQQQYGSGGGRSANTSTNYRGGRGGGHHRTSPNNYYNNINGSGGGNGYFFSPNAFHHPQQQMQHFQQMQQLQQMQQQMQQQYHAHMQHQQVQLAAMLQAQALVQATHKQLSPEIGSDNATNSEGMAVEEYSVRSGTVEDGHRSNSNSAGGTSTSSIETVSNKTKVDAIMDGDSSRDVTTKADREDDATSSSSSSSSSS